MRSQTSTPEASPVHRPDKDASVNISFSVGLAGDKNPAPSASSGGFSSWFPGMRSTNVQPSSDRTSAEVGPTKSSATEELVSVFEFYRPVVNSELYKNTHKKQTKLFVAWSCSSWLVELENMQLLVNQSYEKQL